VTDLKVEIHVDGSIGLKWKCANPAGSTERSISLPPQRPER
jgi:hypothetical protein